MLPQLVQFPGPDVRIPIKNWSEDDRPREKLLSKGNSALSDAELMAILIRNGTSEKSAVDLAREVLAIGHSNLVELGKLSMEDFTKVKGIGKAKALTLMAALEIGRRRQLCQSKEYLHINNSKSAASILMPLLSDLNHEKFCLMCINNNNKLLHYEFVSSGGTTGTIVDTKIVFKTATRYLANRLIIAHNHPSGSLKPSNDDLKITDKIKNAAPLLDMELIDHIIVASHRYYSFADEGLL